MLCLTVRTFIVMQIRKKKVSPHAKRYLDSFTQKKKKKKKYLDLIW